MSEDFGSYLKHERELRGVPLDEIAESTKISLRFLRALEENRFEDLPGEVFIKGFIRSYGQAIGSNVDELMAVYHESTGKSRDPEPSADTETPPAVEKQPSAPESEFPMKAVVGFVVALLIIGGGGYWITAKKGEKPDETRLTRPTTVDNSLPESEGEAEPLTTEEEKIELPNTEIPVSEPDKTSEATPEKSAIPASPEEAAAVEPGPSEPVKNTFTVPENTDIIKDFQDQSVPESTEPDTETTPGETPLSLVITVDENSWFNLRVDDQRDQDFILPPGGSKTIQAKVAIVMTIGNRRATKITLNGQSLDLPESPDNVIRNLTVNAELLN